MGYLTTFWVINLFIYWALIRGVILLEPRLEVYRQTHKMDKNTLVIFEAIVGLVERVQDYLFRHKEDFNVYQFADVFYKMLYSEVGEGIQDRLLNEFQNDYSGKVRFGVYSTPTNVTERLNTTLEWGGTEFIGVHYGIRF